MKFKLVYSVLTLLLLTTTKFLNGQSDSSSNSTTTTTTTVTPASMSTNATTTTVSGSTASPTTTSTSTSTSTTTSANKESADCGTDYCNKNGNCSMAGTNKVCTCNSGFMGDKCDYKLNPQADQCLNKGEYYENIANPEDAKCICKDGYTGSLCEKPTCIDYCNNYGRCDYNETNNQMACSCLPRFFGKQCEFDRCSAKDRQACLEKDKCYLYYENGTCSYASGQDCNAKFCFGNGLCDYASGHLMCKCNVGFSGPQCKTNLCNTFCLNNGTCLTNTSSISCRCADGFEGERCASKSVIVKPKGNGGKVLTYILVFTLLICVVAVIVFVYKRGGLTYVQETIGNITYRLRSYQRTPNSNSSRVPYMQHGDKPDDTYADPFS